ncbi:hypothetical protein RB195_011125 [Necator americanus]|uniref:Uncharacterized protein n=1 Tax=Necator americanus TaxID=51031 RepID=A0ABR1D195_NECAM
MFKRKSRGSSLIARKTPSLSSDRETLSGIQKAHADFISFLYASHGESYDEYVGTAESTVTLPREKVLIYLYKRVFI